MIAALLNIQDKIQHLFILLLFIVSNLCRLNMLGQFIGSANSLFHTPSGRTSLRSIQIWLDYSQQLSWETTTQPVYICRVRGRSLTRGQLRLRSLLTLLSIGCSYEMFYIFGLKSGGSGTFSISFINFKYKVLN